MNSVVRYLTSRGYVPKVDGQVITVRRDRETKMALVDVNGDIVMEGNYWDFHPECHGMYDIPRFHGVDDLADVLFKGLKGELGGVTLRNLEYVYDDEF